MKKPGLFAPGAKKFGQSLASAACRRLQAANPNKTKIEYDGKHHSTESPSRHRAVYLEKEAKPNQHAGNRSYQQRQNEGAS
jgi:hypothetical protein